MSVPYKTVNTFSRTPSAAQIISYILITIEAVFFYVLVQPHYKSETTRTVMLVIFSISLAALFLFTLISSCSDPSDQIMVMCKNLKNPSLGQQFGDLLYCDYCKAYVKKKSKHCRQCDRCVEEFDHHCMWINNCIGGKNYKLFIAMILSTFSNFIAYIAGVALLSVEDYTDILGQMITNWVYLVVICVFAILIFNLVLLHIFLICKGLSTYEFLVIRKQQQEEEQLEQKRKEDSLRLNKVLQKQRERLQERKRMSSIENKKEEKKQQKKIDKTSRIVPYDSRDQLQSDKNKQSHNNLRKVQSKMFHDLPEYGLESRDLTIEEKGNERSAMQFLKREENMSQQKQEGSEQSIKISSFFTKNKSFTLFISNEEPYKPKQKGRGSRTISSALDMMENKKSSKKKIGDRKKNLLPVKRKDHHFD